MRVVALISACMMTLAGCGFAPMRSDSGYPKSFPTSIEARGECPAFGVGYLNRGLRVDPATGKEEPAVLTIDVLGLPTLFSADDELLFFLEDKVVRILFVGELRILRIENRSGQAWRVPGERTACRNGEYVHYPYLNCGGGPGMYGCEGEQWLLTVGSDGSLIARREGVMDALFMLFPVHTASGTAYYRFPPLRPAAAASPD